MNEEGAASAQQTANEGLETHDSVDGKAPPNSDKELVKESDLDDGKEANHAKVENPDHPSSNDEISGSHIPEPLDNEARLQQLESEHETLKSQYMRIAADFDNFRKRQSRDQDDLRLQLTCNTLSSILPVVDNFERARQQLEPQGEEAQALHRSYQGLYKQLVEVLKQLGVAPMRVVGQGFDPSLHEAVLREPSDDQPEDVITEELQRGYHLNGRVLRHALVKVSMGPGPGATSKTTDESEENLSDSSSRNDLDASMEET